MLTSLACLRWCPYPSSLISSASAAPQLIQNIDLLLKTWDKCIPTRSCHSLSQIIEVGAWGVGQRTGIHNTRPDHLMECRGQILGVFSLQISTKTITGVKRSQRMCATKYSKQIISAVQPAQPSAPLFSIISCLGSFLLVQTSLLLSLYLLPPVVVFPSRDFTDLQKDIWRT